MERLTDVALENVPISRMYRVLGDMCDWTVRQMAIRLSESFEISWSRSHTTAPNLPFWNQHSTQLWIMVEFLRHLLRSELHVVVVLVALDEHSEAFVCSMNDVLAVLLVRNRITELLPFLFGICGVSVFDISPQVLRWRDSIVDPSR